MYVRHYLHITNLYKAVLSDSPNHLGTWDDTPNASQSCNSYHHHFFPFSNLRREEEVWGRQKRQGRAPGMFYVTTHLSSSSCIFSLTYGTKEVRSSKGGQVGSLPHQSLGCKPQASSANPWPPCIPRENSMCFRDETFQG